MRLFHMKRQTKYNILLAIFLLILVLIYYIKTTQTLREGSSIINDIQKFSAYMEKAKRAITSISSFTPYPIKPPF